CNGCRNCISACPYGVIGFNDQTGTVHKCTLCYDRLQTGMQPACAKACPTESIQFGYIEDLHAAADKRLANLKQAGYAKAQLYGRDEKVYGGLNAFFLLMDQPETYGLVNERNAVLPRRNTMPGYVGGGAAAAPGPLAGPLSFRGALADMGRLPAARPVASVLRGGPGIVWGVFGTAFGVFICGYTGVLLAVSNQPVWSDGGWVLGELFLASALAGSAALLLLL